jgi:phenylacetate-CoA ligase
VCLGDDLRSKVVIHSIDQVTERSEPPDRRSPTPELFHNIEQEQVIVSFLQQRPYAIRRRVQELLRKAMDRTVAHVEFVRLEGGILGRLDDMLIVRGVNVFPTAIEGIVRRFAAVDEFQIEVFRDGALDELRVLLEVEDASVTAAVREAFRTDLGLRLQVDAVPPRTLPRYELKARRVVRK